MKGRGEVRASVNTEPENLMLTVEANESEDLNKTKRGKADGTRKQICTFGNRRE